MPHKGGSGGSPPDEEEQTIRTSEGIVTGAVDRSTEFDEGNQAFIYGDIVHDEEHKNPEDLVVVNLPDVRADQWELGNGTLADRHPACPSNDSVVIVVPLVDLEEYLPEWDEREEEIPLQQLKNDNISISIYPSMKLDLIEPSHLRD